MNVKKSISMDERLWEKVEQEADKMYMSYSAFLAYCAAFVIRQNEETRDKFNGKEK